MKRTILIFALIILGATSCKYEKLLKSTDYKYKYDKALEYYSQEDYMHASGLFDQLRPILKATKYADTVFFYNAYCSYEMNDYILAEHYFNEFYKTFGNSPFALEAEYMTGYCNYKMSPRISLEQSATYNAITSLSVFISRHPSDPRVSECQDLIIDLKNKLTKKSFSNSKLYFDLGKYKAAIIALNNSISDFPDTKYREEIMFLVLRANFLLASNSVTQKRIERFQSTVDEYYSFTNEFPESEYNKQVEKIYKESNKVLQN
ncbi:MAG: outer membrane protein assembly factor BamD [Bacteroidales bacterium]|nr:outer membrane protein assembly factor BamD [Bacteroidales bacterium]